jgi:cobalamin biosynthesis Mg chelatase CobN
MHDYSLERKPQEGNRVKVKTLGMLFGTVLWAASMAIAAPQQTGNEQNNTGADQTQQQGAQTNTGTQAGQTGAEAQGANTGQTGAQAGASAGTQGAQAGATTGGATHGKKLPRTAGETPLAGVLGLIAVGAAAGLRFLNRRTA